MPDSQAPPVLSCSTVTARTCSCGSCALAIVVTLSSCPRTWTSFPRSPLVTLASMDASIKQEQLRDGSQAVTLEVVSPAVLSVVGLPRINGVEGATHITLPMGAPISIEWPVRNTGGDTGRARMNTDRWGLGTFVTIPGGQTVSLLTAQTADPVTPGTRTVVITVQDEFLQTLDTFTFSFTAFSP